MNGDEETSARSDDPERLLEPRADFAIGPIDEAVEANDGVEGVIGDRKGAKVGDDEPDVRLDSCATSIAFGDRSMPVTVSP